MQVSFSRRAALMVLAVAVVIYDVSVTIAQIDIGTTRISGKIFALDKPLPGATVSIFPLQAAWSGPMPVAKTDDNGYYRLTVPAVGKTRVIASDSSLGYPNTFFAIFSSGSDHEPEVDLTPGTELENVNVHLGEPDGTVDISVEDGRSGERVTAARVTLSRKDDPTIRYSTDIKGGGFTASLPRKQISVVIDAPGYQRWEFIDVSTQHNFIELEPYEHKTIKAALNPSSTSKSR